MEKLSETDEKRIMAGLEKAISMTNKGEHPNDALTKVAQEGRFSPPIISRMAEAYNVSKTLSHMKTASGSERAASFPLADPAVILESLYPSEVVAPAEKAAAMYAPEVYSRPESVNFNKAARLGAIPESHKPTPYARDTATAERKSWDKRAGLVKKATQAKHMYRANFWRLTELAKEAGDYFRRVGHSPFAEVESQVIRAHGELGKAAMDMVYSFGNLKENRLTKVPEKMAWYRATSEPYNVIERMLKVGFELHRSSREAARAELELEQHEEKIGAFKPAAKTTGCLLDGALGGGTSASHQVKLAGGTDLGSELERAGTFGLSLVGPGVKSEESVKRKALSEVTDPIHESRLNGIKMKAVLNDFLSNDPILSTYDPQQVTTAYNQLVELAPGVAQQPAVVRGMLRRMLQQEGVVEPFEAQQATMIERHLRGMAPDPAAAQAGAPIK